jgi:glycosyltransferase involved in cell wall biosynthesis
MESEDKEIKLAVAIPTCCRSNEDIRIGYVLESLALQSLPMHEDGLDIFIWDEGPVSVLSDRWTRLIVDLLGERGHRLTYLRRGPSRGVAAARRALLSEIPERHDLILMLDDDLLMMPDAIEALLKAAGQLKMFGFLQGTKIELDTSRSYHNDINRLNRQRENHTMEPIYFGDGAFLLVARESLKYVQWDIVTKFTEEGLAGEDVAISLMIADKLPCFGIPEATGYHLSLATPRWRWETSSDVLQLQLLRGVVSDETLKMALPHLAHCL